MELKGKVAFVTGASRGLGKVLAQSLASAGASVAVADIRDDVEVTAKELSDQGFHCVAVKMDISDYTAVEKGFKYGLEKLGPIDILVNNAAITDNMATVVKMDKRNWDREISVNLSGAFYCIKQVLKPMMDKKWGRIINIISGAALQGGFGQCSYSSSKSGLIGLARSIALEGARFGVTANCVTPGLMPTPAFYGLDENIRDRIIRTIPSRQVCDPQYVANVVVFLSSEKANYITGAIYDVTGGQELFTY
jgi:3-oxoacyl-[acyl-carrier protein] reductase